MHWLAQRLAVLRSPTPVLAGDGSRREREDAYDSVHALVVELARRDEVLGAFVSRDGFLVDADGDRELMEAAAARAEAILLASTTAEDALGMGDVEQIVVAGDLRKLVLLRAGPVVLGIVAPASAHLATALAEA